MTSKTFLLFTSAFFSSFFTGINDGEPVLKLMYQRYEGKWQRSLVFDQTTEVYRNDSLKSTQTWHEAMLFPDKLRIDIEPVVNNRTYIFRGDSTYAVVNGRIRSASNEGNDLIFLLGGLYFYPFEKTLEKLKSLGYDTGKSYETEWKGRLVYVVGVSNKDEKANQLWIDKRDLYLVRMMEFKGRTTEEGIFENHIKIGGGWTETKASFYFDGKLAQVETYHDSKALPLDEHFFDPFKYSKYQPY